MTGLTMNRAVLVRVRHIDAVQLGKGGTLVSPASGIPFEPLKIRDTRRGIEPKLTVFVKVTGIDTSSTQPWRPATDFYLPPTGATWDTKRSKWTREGAVLVPTTEEETADV